MREREIGASSRVEHRSATAAGQVLHVSAARASARSIACGQQRERALAYAAACRARARACAPRTHSLQHVGVRHIRLHAFDKARLLDERRAVVRAQEGHEGRLLVNDAYERRELVVQQVLDEVAARRERGGAGRGVAGRGGAGWRASERGAAHGRRSAGERSSSREAAPSRRSRLRVRERSLARTRHLVRAARARTRASASAADWRPARRHAAPPRLRVRARGARERTHRPTKPQPPSSSQRGFAFGVLPASAIRAGSCCCSLQAG